MSKANSANPTKMGTVPKGETQGFREAYRQTGKMPSEAEVKSTAKGKPTTPQRY